MLNLSDTSLVWHIYTLRYNVLIISLLTKQNKLLLILVSVYEYLRPVDPDTSSDGSLNDMRKLSNGHN